MAQHFGRGLVGTPSNFGKMGARPSQPELLDFLAAWFVENGWSLKKLHTLIVTSDAYGRSARHPKWKGCGFLRTSAELANLPGHPAIKIGAAHKKKFEDWLRISFEAEGIGAASQLARQILVLLDGSFAVVLLHRDASYMETAGDAAFSLVDAASRAARARKSPLARAKRCRQVSVFAQHLQYGAKIG